MKGGTEKGGTFGEDQSLDYVSTVVGMSADVCVHAHAPLQIAKSSAGKKNLCYQRAVYQTPTTQYDSIINSVVEERLRLL